MFMLNGFLTYWKKMISLFRDFLNMVSFKVSLKETESCALVLIRNLKSCLFVLWRVQIANQILTSVGLHILIIKLPVPRALSCTLLVTCLHFRIECSFKTRINWVSSFRFLISLNQQFLRVISSWMLVDLFTVYDTILARVQTRLKLQWMYRSLAHLKPP